MKRKNFNFDVMTAKASEGIKLSARDNEYSLNCIDLVSDFYTSGSAEQSCDSEGYPIDKQSEEDEDNEQRASGALLLSLLSIGATLLGLLMLVI